MVSFTYCTSVALFIELSTRLDTRIGIESAANFLSNKQKG